MKAIAVDDEALMLGALVAAIEASPDVTEVTKFLSCNEALDFAKENPIDVAFLDINMRGMGGLALAEKISQLQPACKIIFCTGYEEYAVSAFQLHVSGYLMKPITPEAVQKEIDHIKGVKATEKLLTIKCFGNFEVLYNEEILSFKRKKAKEFLAVLIDRNGCELANNLHGSDMGLCAVVPVQEALDVNLVADLDITVKREHFYVSVFNDSVHIISE